MAQPFLGEIKLFAGNFQIRGWAYCNGQLLSIAQYDALYTLLGTTYGGDGVNTFALPNLQSRVALHQGTGGGLTTRVIGEASGVENASVSSSQLPSHTHQTIALTGTPTATSPANALPSAVVAPALAYVSGASSGNTDMLPNATAISSAGGSVPHNNIMPVLALNYLIALEGVYPSQN
ncbi:MAG: tail fiber protein [Sphingomonas sp.]|jgi:microcystin-dependent protein|uniref:phage tail protein n=1 Tax=Sphingomonas sp. TaxID=28214 RepID=UPI0035624C2C